MQDSKQKYSEEDLATFWHMRSVVGSCVHPDTQDPIPWAMRTSAFVPTNVPIIAGMLLTAPTPFNTFLWQWVN
jgi:hypothetical protein